MHLVDIQGPQAAFSTLEASDGLVVKLSGAEQIGPAQWRVGGYASEAMIAELEASGLTVTVLLTDAERNTRLRALLEPEA
jgi:hypothetical protein